MVRVYCKKQIPKSAFEWTVNDICKSCNEGWLHDDVEIPVEGFLASLMQGRRIPITSDVSERISLWAAKTAAVRALMDPAPRCIPPEHYQYIKTHLEPPPNTLVWLAGTEQCEEPFMRHIRHGVTFDDAQVPVTTHFTSIVYGCMALYVIGASDERGLWLYSSTISAIEERDVLQIWPPHQSPSWPARFMPLQVVKELTEFVKIPEADDGVDILLLKSEWIRPPFE